MPRQMSSGMIAALSAAELNPAAFVQIAFATATVYVWSGIGSISWNGQTWTGLGSLLGLSVMEDAATVEARGITVTLSGIDPTLLSDCLGEFQLGQPVAVYLGLYSGGSLISSPVATWVGRLDQPTIDVGADNVTISINCENRLLDMNVAVDRRLTHEDQQMDYPGDLGLQFVAGIQEMTLFWGHPINSHNI
jgi:hypothetical protein